MRTRTRTLLLSVCTVVALAAAFFAFLGLSGETEYVSLLLSGSTSLINLEPVGLFELFENARDPHAFVPIAILVGAIAVALLGLFRRSSK